MNPRICLIVGDNHTLHCGVKDYAFRLANALGDIGLIVEVLAPDDWGVKSWLSFCEELRKRQFDIVHVQYPAIGNRKSLCPHFLGTMRVAKGIVVTLHEHSSLPLLQRASTHLFRWTADSILFTDEAEKRSFRISGGMQRIIHIGSNVPAYSEVLPRTQDVLYFGQIRPGKGIEDFLELARHSLRLGRPFNYKVIGSVPPRRGAYYEVMRARSVPEIDWLIDLPFETTARLMASSLAAYLPFPDGASYRRGSLLAVLSNGLPAMTTVSSATPSDMLNVLLPTAGPREALTHLERLLSNPGEASDRGCAERLFAVKFSWEHIARQHEEVYLETLSRTQPSLQLHQAACS